MSGFGGAKRLGMMHSRKIVVHRSRSVDRRGVSRAELARAVEAVEVDRIWRDPSGRCTNISLSNGREHQVHDRDIYFGNSGLVFDGGRA